MVLGQAMLSFQLLCFIIDSVVSSSRVATRGAELLKKLFLFVPARTSATVWLSQIDQIFSFTMSGFKAQSNFYYEITLSVSPTNHLLLSYEPFSWTFLGWLVELSVVISKKVRKLYLHAAIGVLVILYSHTFWFKICTSSKSIFF